MGVTIVWRKFIEAKERAMSEEYVEVHVTAVCKTAEEAAELAEKHSRITGVTAVVVKGNILKFICHVVKKMALVVYGKIKDALPRYCNPSCRPISA